MDYILSHTRKHSTSTYLSLNELPELIEWCKRGTVIQLYDIDYSTHITNSHVNMQVNMINIATYVYTQCNTIKTMSDHMHS